MKLDIVSRVVRHLFFDRSYARYYSSDGWDNSYSDGYDLDVSDQDARYGTLLSLIRRYEGRGPILDVGCGDGILAQRIRESSRVPIVCVDYSKKAIEIATRRKLADCDFQVSDIDSFTHDGAFSMVVFNESLYYLDNAHGILQRYERMLQQNGVLVISMFDTLVTRRIWRQIFQSYRPIQKIRVVNEISKRTWSICVIQRNTQSDVGSK